MGQIMVRLIRAGSMFVGLDQKKEGSKGHTSVHLRNIVVVDVVSSQYAVFLYP